MSSISTAAPGTRNTAHQKIYHIVISGVLVALAFLAVLIGKIVPNVAGFLSYDPKDAVIAISGFIFGPVTAVVITVLVSLIEMLTISSTGIYGLIMNIVSTCSFVVPAAVTYKFWRTKKGTLAGLSAGIVVMTGMMMLWNYIVTPFYMRAEMDVERSVVAGMMMTVFMPFNLAKSGINAALTLLLYKPVVTALRRGGLVPKREESSGGKFSVGFVILGVLALAAFVLLFLTLIDVL